MRLNTIPERVLLLPWNQINSFIVVRSRACPAKGGVHRSGLFEQLRRTVNGQQGYCLMENRAPVTSSLLHWGQRDGLLNCFFLLKVKPHFLHWAGFTWNVREA